MHDASSEVSRKVMALSARLRLVQSQLADESSDVRREQLDGEISRALQSIAAGDREAFLRELLSAFPTAEGGSSPAKGGAAAVQTKVVEVVKPRDLTFEELVDTLLKQWGLATPDQRAKAAGKIGAVGIGGGGGGAAMSEAQVAKLRERLELGAGEVPDAARLIELSIKIVEFVNYIDRVAWGAWKDTAPSAALRANGTMRRFLREYLAGAGDAAGGGAVAPELDRLRELCRAMMSSIARAAPDRFAERFVSQLAPAAIEESVGDSAFRNKDADCWKAYKLRAGQLDRDAIAQEIKQAIAGFVEDWMRRAGL